MNRNELFERHIVNLYESGLNIRQIAQITQRGREKIRLILKQRNVRMRFRGVKYKPLLEFSLKEKAALAKLFGYLLGDGSVSKNKDGRYECSLSFALNENEYVGDVKNITELIFYCTPKIKTIERSYFRILFRRSIARYLHKKCGYPIGKKSVVNPHIPLWIMKGESDVKVSFIQGFLNAEASIHGGNIKIRQAVRFFPPAKLVVHLKRVAKIRATKGYRYYSLDWRDSKSLCERYIRPSNILTDLRELLNEFQILGKIYPYWVWISSTNDSISVHYELYLNKRISRRLTNLICF